MDRTTVSSSYHHIEAHIKGLLMKGVDSLWAMTWQQKLMLILGLGFFIRLYVVLNAATIATDSPLYIELARNFAEGDYYGGLNIIRPPLYPAMISLVSYIVGDLELAGRVVSLVFGTLVIWASFYLGRFIYNERAGVISALFVALHPYMTRFSGEVLTEGLYYFLVTTATLLGLKAVLARSTRLMFFAGLFCALAYLTKPGGIGFLVLITSLALFHEPGRIREDWKRRLIVLGSGWAVFVILALPYIFFLYEETGAVAIKGKFVSSVFASKEAFPVSMNVKKFLEHFPESFSYPFFLTFLYGVYRRGREGFTLVERYLLFILTAWWIVYFLTLPSRRYLVHLMPMALVMAAAGFVYVEQWIEVRFKQKARVIISVLILVMSAIQLPRAMVSLHAHRLPEKKAGLWIKDNVGTGAVIMSHKPIVAYYAEGRYVRIYGGDVMRYIIRNARKDGAVFFAGYPSKLRKRIRDFDEERTRFLEVVKSFDGTDGRKFVLYRVIGGTRG